MKRFVHAVNNILVQFYARFYTLISGSTHRNQYRNTSRNLVPSKGGLSMNLKFMIITLIKKKTASSP